MKNPSTTLNEKHILFNHVQLHDNTTNDVQSDVVDSLYKWISVISPYCGPLAKYGIISIPDSGTLSGIDTFSKDGITLVKMTTPENFIDYIIQRFLLTIGERVDTIAKDGTTTAMLFALLVLKHNTCLDHQSPIDRFRFSKIFEDTIDELLQYLNDNSWTVDTLLKHLQDTNPNLTRTELIKSLAYTTSMISSKGDMALSKTAAEYISKTPVEMFNGSWTIKNSNLETDTKYECITNDYDWLIKSPLYTNEQFILNDKNGTIGTYTNCDMIYSLSPLSGIYSNFVKAIIGLDGIDNPDEATVGAISTLRNRFGIPQDHRQQKNLIVFTSSDQDVDLNNMILKFNLSHEVKIIVISIVTHVNSPRLNNLMVDCVNAASGSCTPFGTNTNLDETFTDCVISDIDISCFRHECHIKNLIKNKDVDNSPYHPYFLETEDKHPFYFKTLESLKEIVVFTKTSIGNNNFTDDEHKLLEDLKSLMFAKYRVAFYVSGNAHHIVSTKSVIQDVLGSIMSVLDNGFVFGGYLRILTYIEDKISNRTIDASNMKIDAYGVIRHALLDLIEFIYGESIDQHILDKISTSQTSSVVLSWTKPDYELQVIYTDSYDTDMNNDHIKHLIQPKSGYVSQITRLKDIIPKFINSEDFIDTTHVK